MNKSKKNETGKVETEKGIPTPVRSFVDFYFKIEGDATGWSRIVQSIAIDDYYLRTMYLDDVTSNNELCQLTDNSMDEILHYAKNTPVDEIFRNVFTWMNEKGLSQVALVEKTRYFSDEMNQRLERPCG